MTTSASSRVTAPHRTEPAETRQGIDRSEQMQRSQQADGAPALRDRLRSAAPVVVAAALLVAVLLGGALLTRNLLDLGLFFMSAT